MRMTPNIARDLVRQCCEVINIDQAYIMGPEVRQVVARPRHVIAWVLRQYELSYLDIALLLGRVNHSTVYSAIRSVEAKPEMLAWAKDVAAQVEALP